MAPKTPSLRRHTIKLLLFDALLCLHLRKNTPMDDHQGEAGQKGHKKDKLNVAPGELESMLFFQFFDIIYVIYVIYITVIQ